MKRTSSFKGFTLIELMVVIVILGILAAVIAPRVPGFVAKAKEGKTKGNLGGLRSALNIYYSDNDGRYPIDGTSLASLVPKYLKSIPQVELPIAHPTPTSAVAANGAFDSMVIGDASGWIYGNDDTKTTWGNVAINCNQHRDNSNSTTGAGWSTF